MHKDYLTLYSGCPVMISNSFINLILQSVLDTTLLEVHVT